MADLVVGLTGGVASGKSEVTRRFEALGVTVADADVAARDAVEVGSEGLAEVVAAFGPEVLDASGALDRAAMRRRIYGDEQARRRLEAILHPKIRQIVQAQCMQAPGIYAIAAIPLLAEAVTASERHGTGPAYPWLSRVLLVDVPEDMQLARLLARDGIDETLARRMIAAQVGRTERLAIADDVIVNDGALDALDAHVAELDALYLGIAGDAVL